MPEAEDFLVDLARHAASAARERWRRRAVGGGESARLHLVACRPRLALLLGAVLGADIDIRVAQAPAPVSWLARRLRPDPAPAVTAPLPANDGRAIHLPPVLEPAPPGSPLAGLEYPLLAVLQGLRCARGSAARHARCGGPLAADLFVLAEAAAADGDLRALLPGWAAALDALYARRAASLRAARPHGPAHAEAIARYRALLERSGRPAHFADADESLAWAHDAARRLAAAGADRGYRRWLADEVVGAFLAPEAVPAAGHGTAGAADLPRRPGRTATLARRPRARAAVEGEDDNRPGPWMVQTSEPHEHAEDPLGLTRPLDREADADPGGVADSLAELESARLVTTPDRACETLVGADAVPRLPQEEPAAAAAPCAIDYPEWDCRTERYLARAVRLHLLPAADGPAAWADGVLARHAGTLAEIRRRFSNLRPHRQTVKRLVDGEEIECDALIAERSESRAGRVPAGTVYQSRRPAPRRIALVLVVDASGSTDGWVAGGERVIDVEKEAALVAACALEAARIDFAVLAFSGEGRAGVAVTTLKAFDAPWDAAAMRRIAALEPDRFTRLGAPVRHATALLAARVADLRLLLLFSDGKPNDCDLYATRYGIEDARQALVEARMRGVEPYCFTVDLEGGAYLPHLFGAGHYTIVRRARQLPLAFLEWLRAAARWAGH